MTYNRYTQIQINQVKSLFEDGKNKSEISRITGIPRGTLKQWIQPTYIRKTDKPRNSYSPITDFESYLDSEEKKKAYSFILGVYLCDGVISTFKTLRAPSIRLFNDTKYPINTKEWKDKLQIILPENSVNVHKNRNSNCYIVLAYSRKLLDLFPQYGEGKKHDRKLTLSSWQQKILDEYPDDFIRGCMQSDGCIYSQNISDKLSYKRFSFVNKSEDIMEFFLYALKLKGILKDKYFHKSKRLFVAQNFSKEQREILERIISKKE